MIRDYEENDLSSILFIEAKSFELPWCEDDFVQILKGNRCLVNIIGYRLNGYLVYREIKRKPGGTGKPRPRGTGTIEIINIAALPRRMGIGRGLVNYIKNGPIIVNVRESNLDAQLFFKRMGFKAIKINYNYYSDGSDAYLMSYVE